MKKIILGLFSMSLFATACKKNKDAPAITEENIAGTYKITASIRITPGSGTEDLLANAPGCFKDDIYIFGVDESLQHKDVGTVCDPAGDQNGSWTLYDDGTDKRVESTYVSGMVTKFDGNTLELTDSEDGTAINKVTLQRQ